MLRSSAGIAIFALPDQPLYPITTRNLYFELIKRIANIHALHAGLPLLVRPGPLHLQKGQNRLWGQGL